MASFERSIIIRTPLKLVYDFFLYTPNTRHLLPFPFRLLDIDMPPVPETGARTTMKVRCWGIAQRWVLVCKELRPPSTEPLQSHPALPASSSAFAPPPEDGQPRARIIMQAEFSPFLFYVHTMTLREAASNGPVEVHDRVDYELRGGISKLLLGRMVLGEMDRLYTFRQGRARRILESAHKPLSMARRDEESRFTAEAVRTVSQNEVRFGEEKGSGEAGSNLP